MSTSPHGERHQAGQVLVLLALGIVAMLAMVGLIVDGGNAFAQQRNTQNGADSAADAGALVLAQNAGVMVPPKTDPDVWNAITAAALSNNMTAGAAYYTDVAGNLLTNGGTIAPTTASAVVVGSAPAGIPPCNDPSKCVDGRASGVRVIGTKTVDTYVARVVGMNSITISTTATAVAGYLNDICSSGAGCKALPVTFPVTTVGCDGTNKLDLTKDSKEFAYGFSASPDGRRIAYHKSYRVYVAGADGTLYEGTPTGITAEGPALKGATNLVLGSTIARRRIIRAPSARSIGSSPAANLTGSQSHRERQSN